MCSWFLASLYSWLIYLFSRYLFHLFFFPFIECLLILPIIRFFNTFHMSSTFSWSLGVHLDNLEVIFSLWVIKFLQFVFVPSICLISMCSFHSLGSFFYGLCNCIHWFLFDSLIAFLPFVSVLNFVNCFVTYPLMLAVLFIKNLTMVSQNQYVVRPFWRSEIIDKKDFSNYCVINNFNQFQLLAKNVNRSVSFFCTKKNQLNFF